MTHVIIGGAHINTNRKGQNIRLQRVVPIKRKRGMHREIPRAELERIKATSAARGKLERIATRFGMRLKQEIGKGTDFAWELTHDGKRIQLSFDMKDAWGALGPDTIKIRVDRERNLINNAQWVIALNKNWTATLFPMDAIRTYLKRCWGTVGKTGKNKGAYTENAVNLPHLFEQIGVTPIDISLNQVEFGRAMEQIKTQMFPKPKPKTASPKPFGSPQKKQRGPVKIHSTGMRQMDRRPQGLPMNNRGRR